MSSGVEQRIRDAFDQGDLDLAATAGIEHYRAEIYSFLCSRLGTESDAHEVLSQVGEDLWRGLATFRWQCSFRTWLYTLARHAAIRHERLVAHQPKRRRHLSSMPDVAMRDRSRTRPYLRTDVKDRFAQLRATLDPDEQTLLVLRLDRGLSWLSVARVLHDGRDPDDAALEREAANLRQRYRSLKKRLIEQARRAGLVDESS